MTGRVSIRVATDADFAPLCDLYCRSVKCNPNGFIQDLDYHGCLIARTREWRKGGGEMVVAHRGDNVIGLGGLAPHSKSRVELCKLHVDGAWQGRGIGRLMTDYLIALAKERDFSEIILHVTTTQTPAINLYRSIGFQPVRHSLFETTVFGEPASFDTLHMELPLTGDPTLDSSQQLQLEERWR